MVMLNTPPSPGAAENTVFIACSNDKDAAWIWEASFLAVGQQLIQSVCEALRNRHIYQDSLLYKPTHQKEKPEMGNFRKQSMQAQLGGKK